MRSCGRNFRQPSYSSAFMSSKLSNLRIPLSISSFVAQVLVFANDDLHRDFDRHLPAPISVLAREINLFVSNTASNPPMTTSNPRQNPGHQIGTPGFLMNL